MRFYAINLNRVNQALKFAIQRVSLIATWETGDQQACFCCYKLLEIEESKSCFIG